MLAAANLAGDFSMKRWALLVAATVLGLASAAALAQSYPSRPVRFVVGFAAGNGADSVCRIVLDDIRERTGAAIVVENKPGALGAIGMRAVMAAPADGYTLMASASATHASGPNTLAALKNLKPLENLTHVARLARFDTAVVVNADSPVRSVQDLAASRGRRSSYGFGTATFQVAATSFARAAGIDALSVPYQAQTAALLDLMAGRVDFVASDLGTLVPLVQSNRLRPIALLSDRRSSLLPDVPTAKEAGYGPLLFGGWVGIDGPKGLPDEVVAWWTGQVRQSLSTPRVRQKILAAVNMEAAPLFGRDFDAFLQEEQARWAVEAAKAGLRVE